MRRQLLIAFLGLLLCGPMLFKGGILLWFAGNRSEITARYCVNLERPQLQCRAACYLEIQLTKVDRSQGDAIRDSHVLSDFRPEFTREDYQPRLVLFPIPYQKVEPSFHYLPKAGLCLAHEILKPPQSDC